LAPWGSALDDGVCVDEELSGAGDEREVVRFAGGDQSAVEDAEGVVPSEGGGEGGGEERAAQSAAAAGDVALTLVLAAVVVEGRQSGERGGLLAADLAEFGHADDEGEGSPFADAGNAEDEVEAAGKVAVLAQGPDDAELLGGAPRLQPGDVGDDHAPEPSILDVLEADLEAGDILLDLLDEGQLRGQPGQALVRRDRRRIDGGGAGGDQRRIEGVVLGPPPMQTGIGFDLARLKHKNREAGVPQMADHALLVAAGRLDPDPGDAGLAQFPGQPRQPLKSLSTRQRVDRPSIATSSFSLAVSIPAVSVLVSTIFVDPCLVKRTL
jgi:hypothetical protein